MSTALRTYSRGDELITMDDEKSQLSRVYHFDHQGTTQCMTNDAGLLTDLFSSDAWGVTVFRQGVTSNVHWYLGAHGYYTRVSLPLAYLRQRYYRPATARFEGKDPLGYTGDGTCYVYARNAPQRFADPTGLLSLNPVGNWYLPQQIGPATACCGDRCAYWEYKLSKPYPSVGWIVQKNTKDGLIAKCNNPLRPIYKPNPEVYYEAWKVNAHQVYEEGKLGAKKASFTDSSVFHAPSGTYGNQTNQAEVRFFLESVMGKNTPATWPKGGPHKQAGDLPATEAPPDWWTKGKQVGAEGTRERSGSSAWDCCGDCKKSPPGHCLTIAKASPPHKNAQNKCPQGACK